MQRFCTHCRVLPATASLALMAALIPTLVAAQPPARHRHGRFMGQGSLFERIVERLDLTPEQQDAIRGVRQSYREELKLELHEAQAAHRAIREQIHAEVLDEAAIREAASTLAEAEAEVALTRARMAQEIRAVLTPEQQQEIRGWLEQRRAFMQENAARFRARLSEVDE